MSGCLKIMPILQSPRPSMSISLKNGYDNGGVGGERRLLDECAWDGRKKNVGEGGGGVVLYNYYSQLKPKTSRGVSLSVYATNRR